MMLRAWCAGSADDAVRVRLRRLLEQNYPRTQRPKVWPFWYLRHILGGAVATEQFRRVVDELLAEGTALELTQETGVRRTPKHLLVLVARWEDYNFDPVTLLTVRGQPDVLERIGVRSLSGRTGFGS
jgi:hypothetical protein